ncbi:MAG: long-chain fatty acid--CoA ligase [Calditrichaeota bacterium]|nr:MAG: long-chain fatty acid--CoA ligase [Calditrichota bacterium]
MSWKNLNQTWHFVEKWADKTPNAEALVSQDEHLSWRDFKSEMDNVALAFLEIGVQRGDRVAFLAMAQNEFLTTYMAANKVGAMWLGLNPKFTLDELRYQIGDSKPSVLVTLRSFMGADLSEILSTLMQEFPFIKKVLVMGEAFSGTENFKAFVNQPRESLLVELEKRTAEADAGDSALLMYTSGSTGRPKGVVQTHYSIIENIRVEVREFKLHNKSRALLHFPINHVAADVEIGFATIMAGGCSVMMDAFHPVESLKMIAKERITLVGQVPVMFLLQMKQPEFRETDFSSVELFVWSGSAAPKLLIDVLRGICAQTGAKLYTGYGSTELCGLVTYTINNEDEERLMHSMGKTVDPFEIKIVDENRNEVPQGDVGEIAMRGPMVFKEYLNKSDATAAVLDADGWFYTSDLAWSDADGYLYMTGRKSEMFKSGGENIYPREIEEVLESHTGVLFAAVIGVADPLFQEVGWAFIMRQPGTEATEDELLALCKERLANFKVPKKFLLRNELPLLATGKVNKVALKHEVEKMIE